MKVIEESDIEQGTSKWHEFRMQGIGGSEAPIIIGISPWKTAYELWEQKLGKRNTDNGSNFITDKGHRLEPKIRAMYEIQSGNLATPCLVMREDKPEHRASLDGRDAEKRITVEMKYVGAGEKWEMAINNDIPEYYYAQMQWQLYVTGDIRADYVAYNDKEDKIKIISVEPNVEYIKNMLKEVEKFWKLVKSGKEPALSERDWKNVRSKDLGDLVDEYKSLTEQLKPIQEKIDVLKKQITGHEKINHPRSVCREVKIQEITRKGSVDWKKIVAEHLPDFDTSGYVKASTTYRSIKL